MDEPRPPGPAPDPRVSGPLTRSEALALLDRGAELLASGDFDSAGEHYARVIGFDDPVITAAAALGLGEVRYRLDDEAAAVATWAAVTKLGETPSAYAAWRNIAAARVRDGDLAGAIDAYREADKRAPREDKAEIANRLGWLAKETGDQRSSRRYFAAGRGDSPLLTVTIAIIALTSIVSLTVLFASDAQPVFQALVLDKPAVAAGEYWRLWTVTLLHADPLHLLFNMYALFLAGPIVERWYGRIRFLVFYLACAAAGSTASFVFGGNVPAVGASGAIFGLFGILLAAGQLHHPVDRQGRVLVGQLGILILINLFFGFASGGTIDNAAHIGGLVSGLWLGALFLPTGVPTLSSLWHRPAAASGAGGVRMPGAARTGTSGTIAVVGLGVVAVVVAAGIVVGTEARRGRLGSVDPTPEIAALMPAVSEPEEPGAAPR